MTSHRDKHFADAKISKRRHRAHRPDCCRRMWCVDIDTAAATHRDGWMLLRFQAEERSELSMKRAEANFTYSMSLMSDQEKAEFIEQGLAVLAALGL